MIIATLQIPGFGGACVALALSCCNGRQPLPPGPPPEYETPRSYEAKGNIDTPGSDDGFGIPGLDDPPAVPASAEPTNTPAPSSASASAPAASAPAADAGAPSPVPPP